MNVKSNLLNAWDSFARLLRTALGRLLTSSASLIALAVFLWPRKEWHLEPEKLFAFIVVTGIWTLSIFPERRASQHDMQLFADFRQLMTPDWINWLRRHDFGGSFNADRLRPLFEIDHAWEGAAYTFDDPVLKREFNQLLGELVAFAHLAAHRTWPIRGDRWQTAAPDGEESLEEPHVSKRVSELNDGSSALSVAIDKFIILARQRLDAAPTTDGA